MSWWIAETERVVSEQVPAAPDEVRTFYVDLGNLKLLHPFLVSVRPLDRTDTTDGYTQTYRIRENIPLLGLRLPIRFRARLTVPRTGDVITESRQFPRIRLHTVVSFEPADGGTLLTERMRIEAPRPLAGVAVRQAVDAHREMLAGIAAHFGEISRGA
ncbi:MAG TPA: SRPBCC family protein [Mycobacterium sp.]